jgi:zinc protease
MDRATHPLARLGLPALAAGLACLLAVPSAAPLRAQAERAEDIVFPEIEDFAIPQPRRVELDNGMVVMLIEDRELPLVEAIALVRTGERLEPADHAGLAAAAATVMRTGGTEAMDATALDDYLEGKAARIESFAGDDRATVTMSSLAEDFPEVLEVFADVVRRPAFAEDRLAVALNQARAVVARQNDQPQGILFRELEELIFGADSPYTFEPTYASLAAIDRSDLVDWHRRYYRPERTILGLVGDFDADRALERVREAFGDWNPEGPAEDGAPGDAPIGEKVPFREEPTPGVFVVEKSDIDQSNIAMGHLGVLRSDPDYHALEVMNEVLGGGMSSRLATEVRTRRGLAYAVAGRVGSGWDRPGTVFLFTTTKVETTGEAIGALLDEMKAIRTERQPTDEEVARAKRSILSSFVFRVDTPEDVLDQQLVLEYFGYPLDWLSRYQDRIEAVTTEEVRAAARQHLRPEELTILVVGPTEGRDTDLTGFGEVTPVDVTIAPPPSEPAPPPEG